MCIEMRVFILMSTFVSALALDECKLRMYW